MDITHSWRAALAANVGRRQGVPLSSFKFIDLSLGPIGIGFRNITYSPKENLPLCEIFALFLVALQ